MAGAVEIMTRRRGGTKRRVSRARTDQIAKQSDRVTRVLYQEFRGGFTEQGWFNLSESDSKAWLT
ncbi:hypothetical protein D3C87_2112220 [compost metagenome]